MPDAPLRFCMITTFYPPYAFGGDAMFVYRLSNSLAERGHRVDVVFCRDAYQLLSRDGADRRGDYPNQPLVTLHGLHSRLGPISPLITHQTGHPGLKAAPLREVLRTGRFDVTHFHNISLIGPLALRYGTGVKLYTFHEHWLVCPTHVLWKFNRAPCSRKHCLFCTIHAGRPPQWWRYTPLLRSMLAHVDAFITPSRFAQHKHQAMGFSARAPVVHIPHFLPLPPTVDGPAPHPRAYFLYAGRLEKLKGVQVLIEAFRGWEAADLLIAGTGTYEAHLRALAAGHPRIAFLGHLAPTQLLGLVRHAVAVIVPSIGYEVFPMILLEAFAQRTPVIVHDLGPLPEIVSESGGGLVYRTVAELREALRVMLEDAALRRRLGEQGHAAYLRQWTPEPHLRQYFDLISRIADQKAAAAERGAS